MSDAQIAEFVQATGAGPEVALEYLRRARGATQEAVSLYEADAARSPPSNSSGRSGSGSQIGSRTGSRTASRSGSSSTLHRAPRHRFATFSDLAAAESAPQSAADAGAGDDPAQLFTGGEKSALAVTNPNDPRARGGAGGAGRSSQSPSIVDEIMRKAREQATSGEREPGTSEEATRAEPQFRGRGARLGSENDAGAGSVFVGGSAVAVDDEDDYSDSFGSGAPHRPVLQRTMYFWSNGFSIDDGPLYRFDDPRNEAYLRAINMGRAPTELLRVGPHQDVDVRIEQRHDEEYVPPPPSLDNSGPGHRLGSAAPMPSTTVSSAASSSPASPGAARSSLPQQAAPTSLGSDGDASVQIRLADGSVRRARFEAAGPVSQLYDYVDVTAPSSSRYVLQTPMPPRKLEDREMSLRDAGVVGAVVVQRRV